MQFAYSHKDSILLCFRVDTQMKGTTLASYSAGSVSSGLSGCSVSQEAAIIRSILSSDHRAQADSQRIREAISAYYFLGSEF